MFWQCNQGKHRKPESGYASGWHYEKKPFQSWELSNNNAEIRRVRQRIESLTRANEVAYVGWEFDGGHVEANRDQGRLQVFFDGKPEADARQQLKENGFRWAPSVGAWQRLLNDNATMRRTGSLVFSPFPASSHGAATQQQPETAGAGGTGTGRAGLLLPGTR